MKNRIFLIGLSVLLVLFTVAAIPQDTKPHWITVEVIEVFCDYRVGEAWVEGDMYYERGSVETGYKIALSDHDPFPEGFYTIDVNLDLNLATGKGYGYGGVDFESTDPEGMFSGWWKGKLYEYAPGVWLVSHAGSPTRGTGALSGWKTYGESFSIDPTPYAGTCPGGTDPFGVIYLHLNYIPPVHLR